MINLIKNEFIKLFGRAKTWIVFVLFIVFVGLNIFGTWYQEKQMMQWSSPEYQLQMAEENLKYAQDDIKRAEESGNEEWIASAKEYKQKTLEDIEFYKKEIQNVDDPNAWKDKIDESIKMQEEQIKSIEDEGITELNNRWYNELKENIEDLKYAKEHNIKPLEGWEYEAFNMFMTLNNFFGLGILVAGIAVFMSDIVAGECTPATLKFLLVQPIKRGKVLLSKFIVSVLAVVIMIIVPQILGIAFVNAHSGLNVSEYPIRIEQQFEKVYSKEAEKMILQPINSTSKLVTKKEAIAITMGYEVLFIIAACSVVFMISAIFSSSMISMAVSVIGTVFLTIGTAMIGPLKDIAHLLFTSYADLGNLIMSGLPYMYNNPNLNTTSAIICFAVTTIVAYSIGYIVFTKKDILI